MSGRLAGRLCAVVAICALATPAVADGSCVSSKRSSGQYVGYNGIQLIPQNIPSGLMSSFRTGYGDRNSCNGSNFPGFSESASGTGRTVYVNYYTGFNPSNDRSCGEYNGSSTVSLYQRARTPQGTVVSCAASPVFRDTVAHELGHVYALDDQYSSSCSGWIMSQVGFTSSGSYVNRTLRSSECDMVADTFYTPYEQYEDDCASNPYLCDQCEWWMTGCGTPIVLDLGRTGFDFTSLDDGVRFDLNADQSCERTAWTAAGSKDVFLVWDRNKNGLIDNGTELFGGTTPYLGGTIAENGYLVLAELDVFAGNGDGYLTSACPGGCK